MSSDILFRDDDAHMARGWLSHVYSHFESACDHYMRYNKFEHAVTSLDFCLDMYERYMYHMANLGLPIPPEQVETIQTTKALREENAKRQKKKEDDESLERIKQYFKEYPLSFGI